MTHYLGWINTKNANNGDLSLSRNRLNSSGMHALPLDHDNIELFVDNQKYQPFSMHQDNEFIAFIIGYSHWREEKYTKISDSENPAAALLQAYHSQNTGITNILSGHCLAGIINKNDLSINIYSDKIGTHTLYYTIDKFNNFIFSSNITLIKNHETVDIELSRQSIYNYLYFHVIPSPDTIYQNVSKLGPAQHLKFSDNKIYTDTYWIPSFIENSPHSEEELSHELNSQLNNAVNRCLSDTKTGAFLSGGLDSSTVCGYLSKQNKEMADCFSIGFDEPGYDEIEYAQIAAKHFNLNLHKYYVTPDDVWEAIPKIAEAYSEPFGNSSAIPAYFCARFAKQNGMHALLAGDGGDELFAGNERYAKQKVFGIYDGIPNILKNALIEPLLLGLPFTKWTPITRKARSYIEQARITMPARMESYNYMNRIDLASMFDPSFQSSIDTDYPINLLSSTYNNIEQGTMLNKMLYLDWKFTLADNDLFKVNRMCEINDIQVRYPMLDDNLLEFSTQVPSDLKLKKLKLRYFYKRSLGNFLPNEIIHKPKQGFGLPFGEWLKKSDKLQETIYDSLSDLRKRKIFRDSFLDELISTHKSGHAAYYGTMIWVLAMLEQWFKMHFDKH